MNEKEIFFRALEQPSVDKRQAFLDGACGGDMALRHKVDQLLEEHDATDSLLQTAAVSRGETWEDAVRLSEGPGDLIGRYKLLQKIGEGGFGVVYMAEQKAPVKRRVALKIIKLGMDTKQVVGRFEAERQALAMMDHLNIAKVLDAGATETGRPFFVMELVKGIPITHYCDENQLSTEDRLKLFIPVCQAIQHAHQKGIIHRDIKPSNIMVTLHDGDPVPKVIDFGIAKATQQELTEKTVFTQYSQFIGTPAYMSPEQAEMSGLDIDTRSDVYSLGVLLYELLTGKTPLDGKELMSGGYDEIKRRIREMEPPKPSTRVETLDGAERTEIARHRRIEPSKLRVKIQGDLDWIVMKALEKDRTRRYETASGLGADVRRFLGSEPVTAVAPTLGYQVQKFYQRNRQFVQVAMTVLAVLASATLFSSWQAYRANVAKSDATEQRDRAEVMRRQAVEALETAERAKRAAEVSEQEALSFAEAERRRAYAADMSMVQRYLEQNNLGQARELLDRHTPKEGEVDLRGWEWRYLWGITRGDHTQTLVKVPGILSRVVVSPDGKWMTLTEKSDYRISMWNLERNEHRFDVEDLQWSGVASRPVFSADSRFFAYVDGADELVVMDLGTMEQRGRFSLVDYDIRFFEFGPGGTELIIASSGTEWRNEMAIHRWNWSLPMSAAEVWDGIPITILGWELGRPVVFDWEQESLVVVGHDSVKQRDSVFKLNWKRKAQIWKYSPETSSHVLSVVIDRNRQSVFAGEGLAGGGILELGYGTGAVRRRLAGHTSWVGCLEVIEDENRLVSASADQTIRIWDLSHPIPKVEGVLRGHDWEVRDYTLHPDGESIITASKDGTAKSWSIADAANERGRVDLQFDNEKRLKPSGYYDWIVGRDNSIYFLGRSPDESSTLWRASGADFSDFQLITIAGVELTRCVLLRETAQVCLAEGGEDGYVRIWELPQQSLIRSVKVSDEAVEIDGDGLASLHVNSPSDGKTEIWDLSDPSLSRRVIKSNQMGAFSRLDGNLTWGLPYGVDGRGNGPLSVYNSDGELVGEFNINSGLNMGFDFSPDGQHFVIAHEPGFMVEYTVNPTSETVEVGRRFSGAPLGYRTPAFTADGRRLVGTSFGGNTISLWDFENGSPLINLEGENDRGGQSEAMFSPDGSLLALRMPGDKMHIWQALKFDEIASEMTREDERDRPLMLRVAPGNKH